MLLVVDIVLFIFGLLMIIFRSKALVESVNDIIYKFILNWFHVNAVFTSITAILTSQNFLKGDFN
jgi:Ca2+/Na+ antiporter